MRSEHDEQSPLMDLCNEDARVGEWPFVQEFGLQLGSGDGPENRAAFEEDLQELPGEWKGRVHCRGDGWSGIVSVPA